MPFKLTQYPNSINLIIIKTNKKERFNNKIGKDETKMNEWMNIKIKEKEYSKWVTNLIKQWKENGVWNQG